LQIKIKIYFYVFRSGTALPVDKATHWKH